MKDILALFNIYELKARMFPAFFVILPLICVVFTLFPQLIDKFSSILFILVLFIIIFIFGSIGRDLGKTREDKLLKKWDGFPSVTFLRYRDKHIDQLTKKRYYDFLKNKIPHVEFPLSIQDEEDRPYFFDQQYKSCTKWLLEQTRDNAQLLSENISYGLSRNMLAMKYLGITFSVLALIINSTSALSKYQFLFYRIPTKFYLSELLCFLILSIWIFFVNNHRTKLRANAFAYKLLSFCDSLS